MRMPFPAMAPAMLLVALGLAPCAQAVTVYAKGQQHRLMLATGVHSIRPTCIPAVDSVNADGSGDLITTRCVPGTGGKSSLTTLGFASEWRYSVGGMNATMTERNGQQPANDTRLP